MAARALGLVSMSSRCYLRIRCGSTNPNIHRNPFMCAGEMPMKVFPVSISPTRWYRFGIQGTGPRPG